MRDPIQCIVPPYITEHVDDDGDGRADFPSDPGGVKQTGSYSFTFTRPGTYNYTCEVHDSAGMRGTIIVQ